MSIVAGFSIRARLSSSSTLSFRDIDPPPQSQTSAMTSADLKSSALGKSERTSSGSCIAGTCATSQRWTYARTAAKQRRRSDRHQRARDSHPVRVTALRITALEIAVARHRPEREEFRIAVVAQIEHPRETGGGVARLVPEAVGALRRRRDIRCRARRPDDRSRPPPSGRAAPRRSARRCSGARS